MVAPSPDWFIGIYDVSLKNGATWVDSLSLDLVPWDVGTEDGTDFSLDNLPTDPQQPITAINGAPFEGSPVIGNLTFELVAVPLPGAMILFLSGLSDLLGRKFVRKL